MLLDPLFAQFIRIFPIKDVKMGAACQNYGQEKRVEVFGLGNT